MIWNKKLTALSFLAVSTAVLVSACGSSDTTGGGGAGSTASSSTATSGSTSGSTSGTASSSASGSASSSASGSSSSSGGGMGACTNAADKAALMDMAAVKAAAQACGTMCVADPNQAKCAGDCMVTKEKITAACGTCWGDVISCGIKMCFNECIGGASAKCDACTAAKCQPAFKTCSGLP